jgi:alkylation response protein AidB-like acyl-CoA dehydrogenase
MAERSSATTPPGGDAAGDRGLRERVRAWLDQHARSERPEPATLAERFAARHRWHRHLYEAGWIGLSLPSEYGGAGLTMEAELVLQEELARACAPPIANWVGVYLVAPTLIEWGTESQKQTYVESILRGDAIWCQAFSEPDAGSDLGAVRTVARREGDGFRLSGAKRWISWASFADHALVLARTGPEEARHRALSTLIVDLRRPGIEIRPMRMIDGEAEEAEVFFDDVEVPADDLVGEFDRGWPVLMTNLNLARGSATIPRISLAEQMLTRLLGEVEELKRAGRRTLDERVFRVEAAELAAKLTALRHLAYRAVLEDVDEREREALGSAEKLCWSEISQQVTSLALEALGPAALVRSTTSPSSWPGEWHKEFFRSKANSIEGGTSEIQRDAIATRGLRMADR